jgi:NO-binding membrane sensor protein with MHYT domain
MITAAAAPLILRASPGSGATADRFTASCGPSIAGSYLLAVFAILAALACAARIRVRGGRGLAWTAAAAIAVGAAVWSTQLAGGASCADGGLALISPRPVLLGALVVPLATGVALRIVAAHPASARRLLVAGAVSGGAWAGSSFLTISAERASGTLRYDPLLTALSVVMCAATATVFCWIAFRLAGRSRRAVVAAALLGAATRGAFYTALASTRMSSEPNQVGGPGLDPFALGLVTAAGSTIVLMFIAVAAVDGLLPPRQLATFSGPATSGPAARRSARPGRRPAAASARRSGAERHGAASAARSAAAPRRATSAAAPRRATSAAAPRRATSAATPVAATVAGQAVPPAGPPAAVAQAGPPAAGTSAGPDPAATGTRAAAPAGASLAAGARPAAERVSLDLTSEELAYVDRSLPALADDGVELLELAGDAPADDTALLGNTAIEDVLAAAAPDEADLAAVEPLAPGLAAGPGAARVPALGFPATRPAAQTPKAGLPGTGVANQRADAAPAGHAAGRGPASMDNRPSSGELVTLLLPTASVPGQADAAVSVTLATEGEPAPRRIPTARGWAGPLVGMTVLTAAEAAREGGRAPAASPAQRHELAAASAEPAPRPAGAGWSAPRLGAELPATPPAVAPRGERAGTPAGRIPAAHGLTPPSLWFPPPASWFEMPAADTGLERRPPDPPQPGMPQPPAGVDARTPGHRHDDPGAPTKPLFLVPARPQP